MVLLPLLHHPQSQVVQHHVKSFSPESLDEGGFDPCWKNMGEKVSKQVGYRIVSEGPTVLAPHPTMLSKQVW